MNEKPKYNNNIFNQNRQNNNFIPNGMNADSIIFDHNVENDFEVVKNEPK